MQSSAIGAVVDHLRRPPVAWQHAELRTYAAVTVRARSASGVGAAIATLRSRPSLRASCGVATRARRRPR